VGKLLNKYYLKTEKNKKIILKLGYFLLINYLRSGII
jgi:hypothetical protein